MALSSMTGFARADGASGNYVWHWEIKSVNAKGLELRLRGRAVAGETVLAEVGGAVLRPAGPVWLPDTDELVVLLDSVGALARSADDDPGT